MVLVVIFKFIIFFPIVPMFDLVHAVDAILIPLKQLRASQNRLQNMIDDQENAIFAVVYASIIFRGKNRMLLTHRLCIASTSCYRSYNYKKAEKY